MSITFDEEVVNTHNIDKKKRSEDFSVEHNKTMKRYGWLKWSQHQSSDACYVLNGEDWF